MQSAITRSEAQGGAKAPLLERLQNSRNGLGLLYTQSGDEDKARVELEAAHSLDPFNLRTTNYLRLLGAHLEAWCALLASTAGLPPPGVTALTDRLSHRG